MNVNGGNLTKTGVANNKPALTPEQQITKYLEAMKGQISKALPKHMTPDRMARIALTTIRTNPKLLQCSIQSLMGAVMQASQLGLEPGLLGHCYLIPYGNECQFIVGYKGMIDLARRSGNIQSISVHERYENDYFILQYGLEEKLQHIPWHIRDDKQFAESGELKGVYLIAKFSDGGHYIHYMPKSEIDKHRERSKSSKNGPWVTDYVEMAKKTCVRSAWKWLPISVEITEKVMAADETVKTEIKEDMTESDNIIDNVNYEVTENKEYDKSSKGDNPEKGKDENADLDGTPFEEK